MYIHTYIRHLIINTYNLPGNGDTCRLRITNVSRATKSPLARPRLGKLPLKSVSGTLLVKQNVELPKEGVVLIEIDSWVGGWVGGKSTYHPPSHPSDIPASIPLSKCTNFADFSVVFVTPPAVQLKTPYFQSIK